jgi:hypothetical protein
MGALSPGAEQGEQLRGSAVGAADPVRHAGVELRGVDGSTGADDVRVGGVAWSKYTTVD